MIDTNNQVFLLNSSSLFRNEKCVNDIFTKIWYTVKEFFKGNREEIERLEFHKLFSKLDLTHLTVNDIRLLMEMKTRLKMSGLVKSLHDDSEYRQFSSAIKEGREKYKNQDTSRWLKSSSFQRRFFVEGGILPYRASK